MKSTFHEKNYVDLRPSFLFKPKINHCPDHINHLSFIRTTFNKVLNNVNFLSRIMKIKDSTEVLNSYIYIYHKLPKSQKQCHDISALKLRLLVSSNKLNVVF